MAIIVEGFVSVAWPHGPSSKYEKQTETGREKVTERKTVWLRLIQYMPHIYNTICTV